MLEHLAVSLRGAGGSSALRRELTAKLKGPWLRRVNQYTSATKGGHWDSHLAWKVAACTCGSASFSPGFILTWNVLIARRGKSQLPFFHL